MLLKPYSRAEMESGMRRVQENHAPRLDEEWVELIGLARSMGLSPEEVRQFLKQANQAAGELAYVWASRRQPPDAMR